MQLHSCFSNIRDISIKTSVIYARICSSWEMKPSHSIWIRVVAPSPTNWRVLLLKLDSVQIENLNLYLDSELLQSLLACVFTSRYHQAGLSMLVLMNYSKPLCDMYRGMMNLCSMLTCWGGRDSLFKCQEVKGRNAPQLSNFISEIIWNSWDIKP